ncbi:unnamed protein product [Discosporangium mesarthrocarpum]
MTPRPRRLVHPPKRSQSEQRFRGMGPRGVSKRVNRAVLETYFDRPLDEAGRALGVSTTIVKRLCRKMGISRWPYRQICSVNKAMSKTRRMIEAAKNPQNLRKLKVKMRWLEDQMQHLFADPTPLGNFGAYSQADPNQSEEE